MTKQKTPVHEVTATDAIVRGYRGTVATCVCGWRAAWSVRDGSAEADAHGHMRAHDAAYREGYEARASDWRKDLIAQGCKCKLLDFASVQSLDCALHHQPKSVSPAALPEHRHGCSCHLSAPCGACENCTHWDHPECQNDCQTCEEHDDE